MLSVTGATFSTTCFSTDAEPTEIYTLSLHDALPICCRWLRSRLDRRRSSIFPKRRKHIGPGCSAPTAETQIRRSEEHTSELQSHVNLVCRLLIEKKKK